MSNYTSLNRLCSEQAYFDTEDRNKMFAFEIASYFTKQINKGAK